MYTRQEFIVALSVTELNLSLAYYRTTPVRGDEAEA
jgi:hypothetical protein